MNKEEEKEQESYSSMVNNNAILLSFEGWIKYIEGFTRGLGTTKTVDASSVLDCVGEVLEYMQVLRGNLALLLNHCEQVLEKNEILEQQNKELQAEIDRLNTTKLEDKHGTKVQKL